MTDLDLVLVGFGHVARRFVTLLAEQRLRLAREHELRVRVLAIATKRHGQIFSPGGVRAASLAACVAADQSIGVAVSASEAAPLKRRPTTATPLERRPTTAAPLERRPARTASPTGDLTRSRSSLDFVRAVTRQSAATARQRRLVVIETTTLDIARGEPATSHIRAALAGGAHVITANKGPVAFAYRSLARAADRSGRRFLFEGAVMDGVPVFNLVRETLPVVRVIGFRGVVNSTTNYILTAMERGRPFGEALAEMQARGVAEADASLDVDGWDAAAKAAALANVLLGAAITPLTVDRIGISAETARRAMDARTAGRRLKLIASARREGRCVTARVALEELPAGDLLAGLDGQQNAIIVQTDLLGEIAVVQRSGSLTQTAYALLSDLITIARGVRMGRATRQSPPPARRRRSL